MVLVNCGLKAGIYENLTGLKSLMLKENFTIKLYMEKYNCVIEANERVYSGATFPVAFRHLMEDLKNG